MPVYFARAGTAGPVKIGWTTGSVLRRLAAIQCCNHEQVILIRELQCEAVVERKLHKHFAGLRVRGEWFRFDEAMLLITAEEILAPKPRVKKPVSESEQARRSRDAPLMLERKRRAGLPLGRPKKKTEAVMLSDEGK